MRSGCSLILASSSPTRKAILESFALSPLCLSPDIDETPLKNETPAALVKRLSIEKREAVLSQVSSRPPTKEYLVLAADTTVFLPQSNKILNKPADKEEARKMLQLLSGKTHLILTGYALAWVKEKRDLGQGFQQKMSRVVSSKVTFRTLSSSQIEAYLQTGEPFGKAGSYTIQGYGSLLIQKMNGHPTTVSGLPLFHILQELERHWGFS